MKATSFRLPTDTLDLLNRLRLPGESQAALIHRALVALEGQPRPQTNDELARRMDELEARLSALESGRATAVQPTAAQTIIVPPRSDRDQALERVRQLRVTGASYQVIADALNREGFPTITGRGQWQPGTVGKLLG